MHCGLGASEVVMAELSLEVLIPCQMAGAQCSVGYVASLAQPDLLPYSPPSVTSNCASEEQGIWQAWLAIGKWKGPLANKWKYTHAVPVVLPHYSSRRPTWKTPTRANRKLSEHALER